MSKILSVVYGEIRHHMQPILILMFPVSSSGKDAGDLGLTWNKHRIHRLKVTNSLAHTES